MIFEFQKVFSVLGLFSILFAYSEMIFHTLKIRPELTRKLVHVATGIISLTFPFVFSDLRTVFFLCGGFVFFLGFAENLNLLGSVTGIKRKSYGSILFPVSVIMCFTVYFYTENLLYYVLPISLLTICDPLAAICGQSFRSKKFSIYGNEKSVAGTLAYLLSSLLIGAVVFYFLNISIGLGALLFLCSVTCISEMVSNYGTDNLFIPLSAIIMLFILNL